ncbi:MAG: hypothetical protein ACPGNV_05280 [Mangrovicoccus sp.]
MTLRRLFVSLFLSFPLAALPMTAMAQLPPHAPGTICLTPEFWCWVSAPGEAGMPCQCYTDMGWVWGTLG